MKARAKKHRRGANGDRLVPTSHNGMEPKRPPPWRGDQAGRRSGRNNHQRATPEDPGDPHDGDAGEAPVAGCLRARSESGADERCSPCREYATTCQSAARSWPPKRRSRARRSIPGAANGDTVSQLPTAASEHRCDMRIIGVLDSQDVSRQLYA